MIVLGSRDSLPSESRKESDNIAVNGTIDSTTEEVETEIATEAETEAVYASKVATTVVLGSEIECANAIVIDLEANTVLAEKSGEARIYPASMTKVLTVLVAVENCESLDETVTVAYETVAPLAEKNATVAGFNAGETVTVRDLLYGAALPSGADATGTLALHISGSEAEFAKLMNEKCEQLGITGTHFTNASGLHDDNHYSTCHDIAVIFKAAMENDTVREVFSAKEYTTSKTTEHPEGIHLESTIFGRMWGDKEFDYKIEVIGGKTGYTGQAKQCLVSLAANVSTGKEYICVVAGGESRYKPVYDTIYAYRHFLGETYDGEYDPKNYT